MSSAWRRSFKAALVFTVVFGLCVFWILSIPVAGPPGPEETRQSREVLAVAVLSGFLTSLVVWWAIVGRARKSGVGRGLITGIACGVLIHPVCWSLAVAGNSLIIWLGVSPRQPLWGQPFTVSHEVAGILAFSVWSLLFYGWVTVVAGALAGTVLGAWQDEVESPDEAKDIYGSRGTAGD
jgi:hypothetical protein